MVQSLLSIYHKRWHILFSLPVHVATRSTPFRFHSQKLAMLLTLSVVRSRNGARTISMQISFNMAESMKTKTINSLPRANMRYTLGCCHLERWKQLVEFDQVYQERLCFFYLKINELNLMKNNECIDADPFAAHNVHRLA